MKIVVGLGNPGPKYETTRHNAGFLAVDFLVDEWKASPTSPGATNEGDFWHTTVRGEKVLLVKPDTFMNLSGQCVGPLFKFYKCVPGDLIVIHDDLDLKVNALRIKTGGGTGGHHGLRDLRGPGCSRLPSWEAAALPGASVLPDLPRPHVGPRDEQDQRASGT